jgi:hypothetical protein
MTKITVFDTDVAVGQKFQVFNPIDEMGDENMGTFHFDTSFALIPDDEIGEKNLKRVRRFVQSYTGNEYECPYIEKV